MNRIRTLASCKLEAFPRNHMCLKAHQVITWHGNRSRCHNTNHLTHLVYLQCVLYAVQPVSCVLG